MNKYYNNFGYSINNVNVRTLDVDGISEFNDNVGIGLENPTEKLDVNGNIKLNGNLLLDGVSRIGIGDATPDYAIDIVKNLPGANLRILQYNSSNTSNSNSELFLQTNQNGGSSITKFVKTNIITWNCGLDANDSYKFKIDSGIDIGLNNRFVITTVGKVGIGTNNPQETFEVNGTTRFGPNSNNDIVIGGGEIKLRDDGVGHVSITYDNDIFKIKDTSSSGVLGTVGEDLINIEFATKKMDISSINSFVLPKITTTERDGLTGENGMMIYNTTTNKFQGYENGAWVNLV